MVLITGADLDRLQVVEHIHLGDGQTCHAVDAHRFTQSHGIKPAGAARPTGGGAEFLPRLAQTITHLVVKLRGKGTLSDSGYIGLGDADHLMDQAWPDASAGTCPAGNRGGAGDIGVGAVVDIKQAALRTFKQHALALFDGAVEQHRGAAQVLFEALGITAVLGDDLLFIKGRLAKVFLQQKILFRQEFAHLASEHLGLHQVGKTNAAPTDLVLIGRANAAAGGADFAAGTAFTRLVDGHVVGHDDMRVAVDHQLRIIFEIAAFFKIIDLLQKDARVEHHPVGDYAALAFVQNAGRNQMQNRLLLAHHEGVSGVVAALVTDDLIGILRVNINNFSLAFVTPLGADNHNIGHKNNLSLYAVRELKSPASSASSPTFRVVPSVTPMTVTPSPAGPRVMT